MPISNIEIILENVKEYKLATAHIRGSFRKVLLTVRFLFKNEFILQNTFTDLQCNLNCALSQRSNV